MSWFSPRFAKFFSQLRKNNNKEWFEANKPSYENDVKATFELFVSDLLKQISKIDPEIKISAKDAIFRIYKDVRFSKDKTPYKDYAAALIGPSGRKDMETPGLYISLNDKEVMIASGAYAPEKEFLHRIRMAIAKKPAEFSKILKDKNFVSLFGEIKGEKNKKLLPELLEDAKKQPLIFNKQFYLEAKLKPAMITSDKLIAELLKYYKAAQPLNNFLKQAQHGK